MSLMAIVRSRVLRWVSPVVLLAFCCQERGSVAQTQPAAPAQTQPASTAQASPEVPGPNTNYTRRELQPNLSEDRDPVASPDASDNMPVGGAAKTVTTATKNQNGVYTLHEEVDEVLLPCTVVDQAGRLVTDLNRGDFQIWEDNAPQTITSFQHGDVPISIGILVDNSGSMLDKRQAVDDAALDLVRHSNPKDSAFVVNFSDRPYLDQGFTSNVSLLEKGLSHYDARGTTAIYDAVAASADEMSKYANWPKQVILVITDGRDNASRLTLAETVRRVQQLNGPVVYSIGLLYDAQSREEAQQARNDLETLSNETGGIAYFPRSLDEVDGIANEVARVIRNQYTIGYHSTKAPNLGGYRLVHVTAEEKDRGKLIVRTRRGYYPREIKQMHTVQTAEVSATK